MKVRVSYSLGMEEVPVLIDNLLVSCRQKITSELDNLKSSLHDVPAMIEQVVEFRTTLSLVDSQLEDIVNLVVGWHQNINLPDDTSALEENISPDTDEEEN